MPKFIEIKTKRFYTTKSIDLVLIAVIIILSGAVEGLIFFKPDNSSQNKLVGMIQRINPAKVLSSFQIREPKIDPISKDFGLVIPKIGVNVPVVDNVDGSNEKEYLWKLTEGVGHFKALKTPEMEVDGAYPDQGGNIFIFGHSQIPGGDMSRYQGVFNQLSDLQKGDKVVVYYQGEKFEYRVVEGKVVEKTALEYLKHTDEETLTLMTCWPLGFENKRYIVRAKRI